MKWFLNWKQYPRKKQHCVLFVICFDDDLVYIVVQLLCDFYCCYICIFLPLLSISFLILFSTWGYMINMIFMSLIPDYYLGVLFCVPFDSAQAYVSFQVSTVDILFHFLVSCYLDLFSWLSICLMLYERCFFSNISLDWYQLC